MSSGDGSIDPELFDEILLCARYGEIDDLQEYFKQLSEESIRTIIKQRDSRGNTALHFCAANGHVQVAQLLLDHEKASLDYRNEGHNTALHWACLNGHLETVKYLVDAGADVKLKNKGGRMPIDEAESQNRESIVLWLLALDMKREKDAGVAASETEDGDVNVNLQAGETVPVEDGEMDEDQVTGLRTDATMHETAKQMDEMKMLD